MRFLDMPNNIQRMPPATEKSTNTNVVTQKEWQDVARFGRNPYQIRKDSSTFVEEDSDGGTLLNFKRKKNGN